MISKLDLQRHMNIELNTSGTVTHLTDDQIEFEFEGSLTFKMLDKLSELFKTEDIDVRNEVRSGGYCETCNYDYTVVILIIKNYKIDESLL